MAALVMYVWWPMSDHGERLARIETKLDVFIESLDDLKKRQSASEKVMWTISGAWAVVVTLAGMYLMEIKHAVAKVIGGPVH